MFAHPDCNLSAGNILFDYSLLFYRRLLVFLARLFILLCVLTRSLICFHLNSCLLEQNRVYVFAPRKRNVMTNDTWVSIDMGSTLSDLKVTHVQLPRGILADSRLLVWRIQNFPDFGTATATQHSLSSPRPTRQ
jgi:hypothetical protein